MKSAIPIRRDISSWSTQSPEPLHLALGVFDGVHVGHQKVLQSARNQANRLGGKMVVVTFDPHPSRVLSPTHAPLLLQPYLEQRLEAFALYGADEVWVIPFDEAFSQLKAHEFVDLLFRASVRTISVGENWAFGFRRQGNPELLQQLAAKHQAEVFEINAVVDQSGHRISSTRIRAAIAQGDFEAAENMLGRPYVYENIVFKNQQLGRTLGCPTANLRMDYAQLPPTGVWLVEAQYDNVTYAGIANLGTRPSVDGETSHLEVHLFDFEKEIYGEQLAVTFLAWMRSEKKFTSLEALKLQIQTDMQIALQLHLARTHAAKNILTTKTYLS